LLTFELTFCWDLTSIVIQVASDKFCLGQHLVDITKISWLNLCNQESSLIQKNTLLLLNWMLRMAMLLLNIFNQSTSLLAFLNIQPVFAAMNKSTAAFLIYLVRHL
jgi:hypothetical protein